MYNRIVSHSAAYIIIIISQNMGGLESCAACLRKQSKQADQYYFQVYNKLPFFGALKDYQKLIKGKQPFNGNPGISVSQNTINISGKGAFNLPTPAGSIFPPSPLVQIKPTSLINLKPIQSIKGDTSVFNITNVGNQTFVKKIKKSNYANLVRSMEGTGQKFNDLQFPPNKQSLGDLEGIRVDPNRVRWLRVSQILKDPVFINESIHPNDLLQGLLGDCYFFSALASLAEQDFRVKNIFPSLQISPNGIYMARVLYNGVYQQVMVDDFFPVNDRKQPLFAKPAGGREIWVMILQKVWAKLYGSYGSINGGMPHQVSHAFSSAPVYIKKIPRDKKKQQNLWNHLLEAQKNGALLCCGSKQDPKILEEGFVKSHAYSILGVYDKPCRLLKLRNPWGRRQWRGRASDYDTNFWNQISDTDKQSLDYEDKKRTAQKDGVFFLVWQDFLKYFQVVDICKINDNAHYNFLKTDFEHIVPKLFQFQLRGSENNVTYAVTQASKRSSDVQKYSRSYLALGKWDEQTKCYKYVKSCSDRRMADNYLEVKAIPAGTYVLYVNYLWTGKQTNSAVVSIYSESAAQIAEVKQWINPQTFLKQIFYDHATNNPKRYAINQQGDWACNDILLNEGGFSYFVAEVDKQSSRKLAVTLNESQYLQKKLHLQPPLRGCQVLKKEVTPSQPLVVVAELLRSTFPDQIANPSPKVVVIQ